MLTLSLSPTLYGFNLASSTLSVFSTGHKQCYWHSLLHSNICPMFSVNTALDSRLQRGSGTLLTSLCISHSSLHSLQISPMLKQHTTTTKLTIVLTLTHFSKPSILLFVLFIAKTRASCVQPTLCVSHTEQPPGQQLIWLQKWPTETALLSVTEALRLARADSKSLVFILLDLSAAFETVNHQILLSTLMEMGISGTALQWSGLTSQIGPSGCLGGVRFLTHNFLLLGFLKAQCLDHFSSPSTSSLGSVIQKHGFSYHCYADDTQLNFSFQPDDPTVAVRIAACLTDISGWMKDHPLQLNLAKTELLVVLAYPAHHKFSIQLLSSTITPSRIARNLVVVNDDQLSFTDHATTMALSCRFALYTIRKISSCSLHTGLL